LYKYSERLDWAFSSNLLAQAVAAKRAAGAALIDLTSSNPTEMLPDYPNLEISRAFGAVRDFIYKPDPFGQARARTAISESYRERGITISPDQLALAASTSEAYSLLFKLLCNPGDEILAPVPSYPLFEFLAKLESVRIVPYRILYDGRWFFDFASLRERISHSTRAIILVNPNNPTGSFLKEYELDRLIDLAREFNLPLISDEVFQEDELGTEPGRVKTLIGCDSVLSFSLSGLSKMAGMPQMKLAWIAINGPHLDRETARERLELILDTFLSVSTPVQAALPELLGIGKTIRGQIAGRVQRNARSLLELLRGSPAHPLHIEGSWSAIVQLPNTLSEDAWVARLIEDENVLVQPGFFYDMQAEPYIVASLITFPEDFDEGLRRIRRITSDSASL
jgi:aspartate/methionine/tyrosine aminotransferase